jgi:hypothetical protein
MCPKTVRNPTNNKNEQLNPLISGFALRSDDVAFSSRKSIHYDVHCAITLDRFSRSQVFRLSSDVAPLGGVSSLSRLDVSCAKSRGLLSEVSFLS